LRLVGAPETNKVMAGELSRLVRRALPSTKLAEPRKQGTGQLLYPFVPAVAALAVTYHRTAARVLWDLWSSTAGRLEPLYADLVAQIERGSEGALWDGARISIRARNVGAFAAGERQIVGVVKNALLDGAGRRGLRLTVDPERPDLTIAVRMHDDCITVSIDLAGRAMHKRGYRQDGGLAPLRETLAAAVIMLSRYDARKEILFDPMAGSGTLAIEGALMARAAPLLGAPSGRPAELALARLPVFAGLAAATDVAPPSLFPDTRPAVVANELDPAALTALRANCRVAGVAADVVTRGGDFRQLGPGDVVDAVSNAHATGVIVCNPPYGGRMGGADVTRLYRDLGRWLGGFAGWRAAFLCANPELEAALGRRPRIKKPLSAQPFRGYFYSYDL
jgi:23S rRNA G2445 N2-methylase RlmL